MLELDDLIAGDLHQMHDFGCVHGCTCWPVLRCDLHVGNK